MSNTENNSNKIKNYANSTWSADDLSNGLRHVANDHPCCKVILSDAVVAIEQMAEALDGLRQPLSRADYTVAKLDGIVRKIAADALIFEQNDKSLPPADTTKNDQ